MLVLYNCSHPYDDEVWSLELGKHVVTQTMEKFVCNISTFPPSDMGYTSVNSM